MDSCQVLNRHRTKYVLQRDVTSSGTCFSIQADDITLDLNGHSVTYGAGKPKAAAFGVLGIACWDGMLKSGRGNGNPCGGSFNGLTILNGRITQSPGMAPFSDAIHLGQGGGDRLHVYNVELTVEGDSAIPILVDSAGAGSLIHNNIIHNNVRTIQSRHQLHGMSIKFDESVGLSPGQKVYENKIFGGAQGGILLTTAGSVAQGNEIHTNGRYTNDFAIYVWGNRQQVYGNVIDAISGRGIQIAGGAVGINGQGKGGKNSAAHDNKVRVIELKQNCEYGEGASTCHGCQVGGAYGIQFDDNPQGDASFNNTVLARADECDAAALRVTDSQVPQNESHDDSFAALRVHPDSPGKAFAWDNAGARAFAVRNSAFVGDTASYHVDWDGAQNEICLSCTFGKGNGNPSSKYVTFSFQNGGTNPVKAIHFRDAKFENDAGKNSTDMKPILSNGDWPGSSEYFIDWTVTILVQDSRHGPTAGATVTLTDALGHIAYQSKTDKDGKLSTPLNEFRMYNTSTQVVKETHAPYQATVSKSGCKASPPNVSIELTETTHRTVEINCGQTRAQPIIP